MAVQGSEAGNGSQRVAAAYTDALAFTPSLANGGVMSIPATPTPGLPRVAFFVNCAGTSTLNIFARIADQEFAVATLALAAGPNIVTYSASAASWRATLTNTSGAAQPNVRLAFTAAQ
jgi:hypothetical protein